MRNWERLEADENYWMTKHYTPGRDGHQIRGIVLHHNAANLSLRGCWDTWQVRPASAHYQVDIKGRIGQYVRDHDTAWASETANAWTIAIEHANNRFAPQWSISEATLDNGAHLVAQLCVNYQLGEPQWGINVYPHRQFSSTACPGSIAGAQNLAYMHRAQHYYREITNPNTKEETMRIARVNQDMYLLQDGAIPRKLSRDEWMGYQGLNLPIVEINANQIARISDTQTKIQTETHQRAALSILGYKNPKTSAGSADTYKLLREAAGREKA